MLQSERKQRIIELLQNGEFIKNKELERYLQVSAATIRRDLTSLENDGLIKRIHGGAKIKISDDQISQQEELTMVRKYDLHSIEKQRIASYAASLVKDGDCIYIDSGSTPAYIYEYIAQKQVIVVTNNMMVLQKVKPFDKASVIIGAGEYNEQFRLVEGPLFIHTLTQFNYDHVFIGVNGIDLKTGQLTCTTLDASSVKKHALSLSSHAYIVADSSKSKEKGIVTFAYTREFDAILTTGITNKYNVENIINC